MGRLNKDEEQLVADLAIDYCDRWRAGEEVSMNDYLEWLPTEQMRQEFKEAVNMARLLTIAHDVKGDR